MARSESLLTFPVRRSPPGVVLALLLGTIPLLLLADLVHRRTVGAFRSPRWDVDLDRSVMEVWGYLQQALAAGMLAVVAVRKRAPLLGAWAATLSVVVLDDSLQWHERFGAWLSQQVDLPRVAGLRPVDLGELAMWAMLGLGAAVLLSVTYVRSSPQERRLTYPLLAIIAFLGGFAVGVDMVHTALEVYLNRVGNTAFIWLEAGGELAAMSLFVAYSLFLLLTVRPDARQAAEQSIHEPH